MVPVLQRGLETDCAQRFCDTDAAAGTVDDKSKDALCLDDSKMVRKRVMQIVVKFLWVEAFEALYEETEDWAPYLPSAGGRVRLKNAILAKCGAVVAFYRHCPAFAQTGVA